MSVIYVMYMCVSLNIMYRYTVCDIYVLVSGDTYVCVCVCMCMCIVSVCVCTYTSLHLCIIRMCVYLHLSLCDTYVCVCVCMCTYTTVTGRVLQVHIPTYVSYRDTGSESQSI